MSLLSSFTFCQTRFRASAALLRKSDKKLSLCRLKRIKCVFLVPPGPSSKFDNHGKPGFPSNTSEQILWSKKWPFLFPSKFGPGQTLSLGFAARIRAGPLKKNWGDYTPFQKTAKNPGAFCGGGLYILFWRRRAALSEKTSFGRRILQLIS